MRKVLALLLLLSFLQVNAQEDSTALTEPDKKTTVTFAALYHNNASYYGQTAAEKMPFAAVYASLKFPSGFYITTLGYRLLNQPADFFSAGSVGAGWEIPLSRKLALDFSYNHSFFPENSSFVQAANTDIASAGISYKHWLTTAITGDFAFGKERDMFATLSNSKQIELGSLFTKNEIWTITPSVDITGGTQRFYTAYITEKMVRDSLLGLPLPTGRTERDTSVVAAEQFNLLSYSLRVPLAYSRARYMIEVAYQLSVLGNKVEAIDRRPRSFLNLSFYYQF